MGISEKVQMEGGALESDGKKWVIAGIPLRAPLKRINTSVLEKGMENEEETCLMKCAESEKEGCLTKYAANEEEGCSTTPTAKEARIPERLLCPPAPRKRKSSSRCNFSGVREFFSPPDLDSVFIRRVERAK